MLNKKSSPSVLKRLLMRSSQSRWLAVFRHVIFIACLLVAVGMAAPTFWPQRVDQPAEQDVPPAGLAEDVAESVAELNRRFRERWQLQGLDLAPVGAQAPWTTIARRLTLALTGTVPSLEELRQFEALGDHSHPEQWWIDRLLDNPQDRRAADYLAERLARTLVGTHQEPFILFRRRRFVAWISEQIHQNRPYDQWIREAIASQGTWTDRPATNFITSTIVPAADQQHPDPERLAGTVCKSLLGIRLDCAQCHDHPFENWTQDHFRGIAAYFGQTRNGITGIWDDDDYLFTMENPLTGDLEPIEPRVPFGSDWLNPEQDLRPREQLARWVTDRRNTAFARATVNRVWGLMCGRPLMEPIDDFNTALSVPPASSTDPVPAGWTSADPGFHAEMPRPTQAASTSLAHPAVEFLAKDFVAHGYDLKRLIRVIAASEVYQLDSAIDPAVARKLAAAQTHEGRLLGTGIDKPTPESPDPDPSTIEGSALASLRVDWVELENEWAVFPLTRLRPEQVAAAALQAASLHAIDSNSHIVVQLVRFGEEQDFVRRYGDAGEEEMQQRSGTVPQRLLCMNGKMVNTRIAAEITNASQQISMFTPDDAQCVRVAYLTVLTREPTAQELEHFTARLAEVQGKARHQRVVDLFWSLINSPSFSWNH